MREKRKDILFYFKLVGILIIPLIALTIYSFSDLELSIGRFTLQKTNIRRHFPKAISIVTPIPVRDSLKTINHTSIITDTTNQRILLFGDSMVEGLSKRLRNYAAENNHELLNVIWYSSSTKIWAESDTITYYLKKFNPSYIFICLGGNELFVRDLDKRENYIQIILQKIGDKPFVWIGPPNWKADTGINDLIKKQTGNNRYFPSKELSFDRKEDGAHPTPASAAKWMDSIAVWLQDSAQYRIRMEFPQQNNRQKGKTEILKPLR